MCNCPFRKIIGNWKAGYLLWHTVEMLCCFLKNDFKTQELPLARIKKIMKLDEDVKVQINTIFFRNF